MISVSSDGGRQWVSEWWMKAMHRTSPFGISIQCLASVETHAHTNIFAFEETLTMKARKYRCRSIHYPSQHICNSRTPSVNPCPSVRLFSLRVFGFRFRLSHVVPWTVSDPALHNYTVDYGQAVNNRGCEAKAEPFRCNVTSTAV